MSNATSIGLPGVGTIRAGISLANPAPQLSSPGQHGTSWQQQQLQQTNEAAQMQMSSASKKSAAMNASIQSYNPPSPFSPAQRYALQDTISSGASATLVKNGQSLISNNLDLTQGTQNTQARIAAARRQVGHMTPQRSDNLAISMAS